jgi:hypothetical protein
MVWYIAVKKLQIWIQKVSDGPFYPFLIGLYPILDFLMKNNVPYVILESVRVLSLSILGVGILYLCMKLWRKDSRQAALITTYIAFSVLSFGTANDTFSPATDTFPGRGMTNLFLLILWAIGLLFVVFIVRWRQFPGIAIHKYLNLVAIAWFCFPLASLLPTLIEYYSDKQVHDPPFQRFELVKPVVTPLPDIYYIILDGYGRQDFLKDNYGFDNSSFIADLESLGFFVADKSDTNYLWTVFSLSSSLNSEYLNYLVNINNFFGGDVTGPAFENSVVVNHLRSLGYQVIQIKGGNHDVDREMDHIKSDLIYPQEIRKTNYVEDLLIRRSILSLLSTPRFPDDDKVIPDLDPAILDHANRVRTSFDFLKTTANQNQLPSFVIAHIISPHPPFIFQPDGNLVQAGGEFIMWDGSDYRGSKEEYIRGYTDQMKYINAATIEMVKEILPESKSPPIIIIQGDHGPGASFSFLSLEETCIVERTAILNAYYFPGQQYGELYADISPVNTFRVIFNQYLGTDLPMLPDKSYYSSRYSPHEFFDVTNFSEGGLCQ